VKTYVAFLRAINVGGRNMVAMPALVEVFRSLGHTGVRTYIQSGNVIFDADAAPARLQAAIAAALRTRFRFDIGVMVREAGALRKLTLHNPFADVNGAAAADVKHFVAFLAAAPAVRCKLPLISPKGDVELIALRQLDVLCLSRRVKGQAGFPNAFVEKSFGMSATTRAWTTVEKLVGLAFDANATARQGR
jgi:uncharacterized protein (DUF1697 family)